MIVVYEINYLEQGAVSVLNAAGFNADYKRDIASDAADTIRMNGMNGTLPSECVWIIPGTLDWDLTP